MNDSFRIQSDDAVERTLHWERRWYDLVLPPAFGMIMAYFVDAPAVRLLGIATLLAVLISMEYLSRRRINAGYLLLAIALPVAVLLGWVHPVLPWLLFAAVITLGFVIGPAFWSVKASSGDR